MRFLSTSFIVVFLYIHTAHASVPKVKLQNAASNDSYIPWVGLGCAIPGNDQFDKGFNSSTKWLSIGSIYFDEAYCYPSRQGVATGVLNYTNNYTKYYKRSDLFIVSKVGGCSGDKMGYKEVMEQVNNELSLWKTTYMDMVLIHWCSDNNGDSTSSDPTCDPNKQTFNATICRQNTWKALIELYLNGTIKAIGTSNFEIKHLNDLINYKYIDGKSYLPSVNQNQFHGYWHEYNLLKFCNDNNILYNSWSTLGTPDVQANKWTNPSTPILTKHPLAIQIGKKYNKTAAQVWLRRQHQLNILVIPRSNNITHMKQNMDIFDFELSDDDMKQLYNVTAPPYPTNLVYLSAAQDPNNLP